MPRTVNGPPPDVVAEFEAELEREASAWGEALYADLSQQPDELSRASVAPKNPAFEQQHPRARGKFAHKAFHAARSAWEGIGHLEHAAAETVQKNLKRLPRGLRTSLLGAWHALTATYDAGWRAVETTAREQGATAEQAQRAARLVATIDALWAKTPFVAGMLGAHIPEEFAFVPVGSLIYLAFSTTRDPLATVRTAQQQLNQLAEVVGRNVTLSREGADGGGATTAIGRYLERLASVKDADGYDALVYAALAQTAGDLGAALTLADRATGEDEGGAGPAKTDRSDMRANASFYQRLKAELRDAPT